MWVPFCSSIKGSVLHVCSQKVAEYERKNSQSATAHVVEHLARLIQNGSIWCKGTMVCGEPAIFDVHANFSKWKSGPSAAVLLLQLRALSDDGNDSAHVCKSEYEFLEERVKQYLGGLKKDGELFRSVIHF